ncbi:MAG: trigger factor family protein [Bacteroidia bacterium]|nr:trigger factor family protein [Bacteroidia bacterium]MDW8416663.1 trigger factor family protein [Bacteroidia bacterium]
METAVKFPKPYLAEGEVRIPASAYSDEYRARIRELRRDLMLPGFRPGQVPSDVVMARYGEQILSELLTEKFLNTLRTLVGEKELFQLPFYDRSPESYQVKPPFADYLYTFRALVVPKESLLSRELRLLRYVYQSAPDDIDTFQTYLRMAFGTLGELEVLPESLPADKHILLRLRWEPYEGATPLRLRWNSYIAPFPWSHLAGRKVGDTFDVPPQALSAYADYIRAFYPDFSLLTTDSVKLTITAGAYSTPLPIEELREKLHIPSDSSDEQMWQSLVDKHVDAAITQLNDYLRKNQLLHAADINIPQDIIQYQYLVYLSTRTHKNGKAIDYAEFQQELAWELLFQNLIASEPTLQVSQDELKETLWQRVQEISSLSDEAQNLLSNLKESETARETFITNLLQNNESQLRRSLQQQRLENFLTERFGEPTEVPLSLRTILLYTL